ncbi:TniQ family protein [Sinorhizobium meliloti]|uniref:TniQ family protein n=1 Tax=Rhizobium meliloti TaxID=382 RepID=UPI0018E8463B|nr:TniQ family protein [Sinorhizobium meliloti]QQF02429.1 TniQ family protein [Sinorhizobium meliloti]
MALRNVVDYHAGETRLGLTSRLAMANGFPSMRDFVAITGTSPHAINVGEPAAVAMLSQWSDFDAPLLSSWAIGTLERGATWRLGSALMSRDMRPGYTHRYCPKCVVGDLANGTGPTHLRPFMRVWWTTRAILNCPEHGCPIKEAKSDVHHAGDFALFIAKHLPQIEAEARDARMSPSFEVDKYVAARLQDIPASTFLDSLETYVAVDLCRNLGRFQQANSIGGELPAVALTDIERGYAIASQGPSRIETVVADVIGLRKPSAGEFQSVFGSLREWLLRNYKREEFEGVVKLFQDFAERYLPIGSAETFVLPTSRRFLHSVRSASFEYNMMEDRVYNLVVQAGLVEPSELTSGRIYFDADRGHEVLTAALETLTTSEIATIFGTDIDTVRSMLDANLMPRVEAFGNSRVYSRVRKQDVDAFLERLSVDIARDNELARLDDLANACRVARCKKYEIFELALNGELPSLRRSPESGLLCCYLVDPAELRAGIEAKRRRTAKEKRHDKTSTLFAGNQLLYWTEVSRRLRASGITGLTLLKLGFLQGVDAVCPRTWLRKKYVTLKSLEKFERTHVSLWSLAAQRGISPRKLRRELDAKGIRPIFDQTVTASRPSLFYRRKDVRDFLQ